MRSFFARVNRLASRFSSAGSAAPTSAACTAAAWSLSDLGQFSVRGLHDYSDFIVCQTIEFVDELVDLPLSGCDLTL